MSYDMKAHLREWMLKEKPLPLAAVDSVANLRAVSEMLYDLLCWGDDPSCMIHANSGVDHHPGCLACDALKRIAESGWKRGDEP